MTSTNHGAAISRNTASPEIQCMRFHTAMSRLNTEYRNSAAPGRTTPINPLLKTDSASPAQASNIQFRRFASLSSFCARSKEKMPSVMKKVTPMSNVLMCAIIV